MFKLCFLLLFSYSTVHGEPRLGQNNFFTRQLQFKPRLSSDFQIKGSGLPVKIERPQLPTQTWNHPVPNIPKPLPPIPLNETDQDLINRYLASLEQFQTQINNDTSITILDVYGNYLIQIAIQLEIVRPIEHFNEEVATQISRGLLDTLETLAQRLLSLIDKSDPDETLDFVVDTLEISMLGLMNPFTRLLNSKYLDFNDLDMTSTAGGIQLSLRQFSVGENRTMIFNLGPNIDLSVPIAGLALPGGEPSGTNMAASAIVLDVFYPDMTGNTTDGKVTSSPVYISFGEYFGVEMTSVSTVTFKIPSTIDIQPDDLQQCPPITRTQNIECFRNPYTSTPTQLTCDCKFLCNLVSTTSDYFRTQNQTLSDYVKLNDIAFYNLATQYPFKEFETWRNQILLMESVYAGLAAVVVDQGPIFPGSYPQIEWDFSDFVFMLYYHQEASIWSKLGTVERLYYATKVNQIVVNSYTIGAAYFNGRLSGLSSWSSNYQALRSYQETIDPGCNCIRIPSANWGWPELLTNEVRIPVEVLDWLKSEQPSKDYYRVDHIYGQIVQADVIGGATVDQNPYVQYGQFGLISTVLFMRLAGQSQAKMTLPNLMMIQLSFEHIKPVGANDKVSCGTWDQDTMQWNINGCLLLPSSTENKTDCECRFLATNYAVLLNADSQTLPEIEQITGDLDELYQNVTSGSEPILDAGHWLSSLDSVSTLLANVSREEVIQFVPKDTKDNLINSGIQILDKLVNSSETMEQLGASDRLASGSNILRSVQDIALLRNSIQSESNQPDILEESISMKTASVKSSDELQLSIESEFSLKLPGSSLEGLIPAGKQSVLVTATLVKNLSKQLSDVAYSEILSISVEQNRESIQLKAPFSFILKTSGTGDLACSYWNYANQNWSQDGCSLNKQLSNQTHSYCECDHLTDFAITKSTSSACAAELYTILLFVCVVVNFVLN